MNPPCARAGGLLASAPALCAGPGEPTLHPCWAAVFSQPLCSVSAQGMGCRNESGLFAVFYHLMMVIYRLLDCSHGNGSCFQHLQPLHAVLAPLAKRVREVRGTTRWRGRAPESPLLQSWSLLLPLGKMYSFAGDGGHVVQREPGGAGRQHGRAPKPLGSPCAAAPRSPGRDAAGTARSAARGGGAPGLPPTTAPSWVLSRSPSVCPDPASRSSPAPPSRSAWEGYERRARKTSQTRQGCLFP